MFNMLVVVSWLIHSLSAVKMSNIIIDILQHGLNVCGIGSILLKNSAFKVTYW